MIPHNSQPWLSGLEVGFKGNFRAKFLSVSPDCEAVTMP